MSYPGMRYEGVVPYFLGGDKLVNQCKQDVNFIRECGKGRFGIFLPCSGTCSDWEQGDYLCFGVAFAVTLDLQ